MGARAVMHGIDAFEQRIHATAAHRDRGFHRDAQFGRQFFNVDLEAAPTRDVDHVEHQHHRAADALQFEDQPQREARIGGIGHADENIGRRFAGKAAEHHVARHLFIGAARAQRIGAGKIDKLNGAPFRA